MAIKDIAAGRYKARAIKGRFFKSDKEGTPGVQLAMEVEHVDPTTQQPVKDTLVWTGWLKGKTDETTEKVLTRSIESLALVGWNEQHNPDGIIPLENFDATCFVDVTVEEEPYTDKEGNEKIAKKVIWINRLGGASFAGAEPNEVKNLLAGIDLKKQMMIAKKNLGIKTETKPSVYNHASGSLNPPPQQQNKQQDPPPSFDPNEQVPF